MTDKHTATALAMRWIEGHQLDRTARDVKDWAAYKQLSQAETDDLFGFIRSFVDAERSDHEKISDWLGTIGDVEMAWRVMGTLGIEEGQALDGRPWTSMGHEIVHDLMQAALKAVTS